MVTVLYALVALALLANTWYAVRPSLRARLTADLSLVALPAYAVLMLASPTCC